MLGRVPHEPLLLAEFGKDAASQMGLEDVTMFRSVLDSVVFHPCDTWSTDKIAREAVGLEGVTYIRTLRSKAPVLYDRDEVFPAGGARSCGNPKTMRTRSVPRALSRRGSRNGFVPFFSRGEDNL